jgi:hypothetical protein
LMTVVAGHREACAFGFAEHSNEPKLRTLKEILNGFGLPTQITSQVLPGSHHRALDLPGDLAEVFERVDAESHENHSGRLLWVCRDPKTRDRIGRVVARQSLAGTLLGYPKCCVERQRDENAVVGQAFCRAMTEAAAGEAAALERALRGDLQVQLTLNSPPAGNVALTDERFPFVQHIACDSCLSSDDSRTAHLNATLHVAIGEMMKTTVEIAQIVDAAEREGLNPQTLDSDTKRRLQNLFQKQDRIHVNFVRRNN